MKLRRRTKSIKFSEVKVGEIFTCEGTYFIKVLANLDMVRAIDLERGRFEDVSENSMITLLPKAYFDPQD